MVALHISTGDRYARLTIIEEVAGAKPRRFRCRCDCGAVIEASLGNLRWGGVQSCGCLGRERVSLSNRDRTIHGHSGNNRDIPQSSEYQSWHAMKNRCLRPSDPGWARYGGRGIKVCDRWAASFKNFITDMGVKPTPQHTLDRFPNNDGNYEPGNCRWATRKEQLHSRTNRVSLTWNGVTRLMTDWVELTGIPMMTLRCRVLYYGWSVERTLTTPVKKRHRSLL